MLLKVSMASKTVVLFLMIYGIKNNLKQIKKKNTRNKNEVLSYVLNEKVVTVNTQYITRTTNTTYSTIQNNIKRYTLFYVLLFLVNFRPL